MSLACQRQSGPQRWTELSGRSNSTNLAVACFESELAPPSSIASTQRGTLHFVSARLREVFGSLFPSFSQGSAVSHLEPYVKHAPSHGSVTLYSVARALV